MSNMDQEKNADLIQECAQCGGSIPPRKRAGGHVKKYCSATCRQDAHVARTREHRAQRGQGEDADRIQNGRKRRPLPEFARDAAWTLRKDAERMERIVADERFGAHKEQVAALMRSHLAYTAEVCQDLLSRIDHLTGE